MSSVYILKIKDAAFNVAVSSKGGEGITLFSKLQEDAPSFCAPGDVALVYTPGKEIAIPACFVVGSVTEGDPACYNVVIEKYDASKEASHLIRYPGNIQEWTDLRKESIQVMYMNNEEISPGILSSSQIEGITVKVLQTSYTVHVSADKCIKLQGDEFQFEPEELNSVKVQVRVDNADKLQQVKKIIKEKIGTDLTMDETSNADLQAQADANTVEEDSSTSPNGVSHELNGSTKREADYMEDDDAATRQAKKIRPSPIPSPASPSSAPASPTRPAPSIDLIKHIAEIAQMVKEMDDEHSERLNKVENEVARIRSILQQQSLFTSALNHSGSGIMVSPSMTTSHSPQLKLEMQPPSTPSRPKKVGKASNKKSKDVFKMSDIHPGELIAVRADRTVSLDAYYWMARVTHVTKNTIKVKWYEPYEAAPSWFYLDTRDDEVDIATIFLKNFELTLKPVRHSNGQFIDIYKPVTDLKKYDAK